MFKQFKARRKNAGRSFWLTLHAYFGLAAGGVFALAGLSGALLVFYPTLDEWLHPGWCAAAQGDGQPPAYEALLQSLRRAEPERSGAWRIEAPEQGRCTLTARYYQPAETKHLAFAPLLATLDTGSGQVLRRAFWGGTAMTWLYDLHYALLLDRPGKIVMALIGAAWLLSLLSGLILWWPKSGKISKALALKRNAGPARLNYDLHKLAGAYGAVVMLVLALTGAALEVPQYFNPMLNAVWPLKETPKPHSKSFDGAVRISADQAAAGLAVFPQAELRWLETPDGEAGSYRVNMRQPGEPGRRFPKTNVWIDQYSGAVLAVDDPGGFPVSNGILAWLHPLHSGEAFGLPGRCLVLIAGLLCPLLLVTGWIRWLQKRRAKYLKRSALLR